MLMLKNGKDISSQIKDNNITGLRWPYYFFTAIASANGKCRWHKISIIRKVDPVLIINSPGAVGSGITCTLSLRLLSGDLKNIQYCHTASSTA